MKILLIISVFMTALSFISIVSKLYLSKQVMKSNRPIHNASLSITGGIMMMFAFGVSGIVSYYIWS